MTCFKFVIYLDSWVGQAIFLTSHSILFMSSVIGNSIVIYLVWRKASLRSPTYLFLSFLAISDLLMSLFGQSSYCISLTILKDLPCTLVRVIAFMNVANCSSSQCLLSLIARDRYLRVSKRQNYLDYTSNRFAVTASIASYLFGMMIASLFAIDNRIIQISSTFAFAVIGNVSFIFICLKSRQIIGVIKDHVKQMQANRQNTSASEHSALSRSLNIEKSVNKSIFSIITLFFVSWTPVMILMAIFTGYHALDEPIPDRYRIGFVWGSTVAYLNGALNHVIYSYRSDAIGREIRRMVAKLLRRSSVAPSASELEVHGQKISLTDNTEVRSRSKSKA